MQAAGNQSKTNDRIELQRRLRPLRELDNTTNLKHLVFEYAALITISAGAIASIEWSLSHGFTWFAALVVLVAIALVGGIQHRLAGLGHESAHYTFAKSRLLNDLLADLFCMFPLFTTVGQYRLVHTAHHQFVNDWERDPDLAGIGFSKGMHRFPMPRRRFVRSYFLYFLSPVRLLRYLWDVLYLSVAGAGPSPYRAAMDVKSAKHKLTSFRAMPLLGLGYLVAVGLGLYTANRVGNAWLLAAIPVFSIAVAALVITMSPESMFFQSPIKAIYSQKTVNILRLGLYTTLLAGIAFLRFATGRNWGGYFLLLWVLPLLTTFPYYMLLRDVYQHANADTGRLTNTRVFRVDPFTGWAVFVYGQGLHLPHHLYPGVPHYNLEALHALLLEFDPDYRREAVECHGVLGNRTGRPSVADVVSLGA